MATSFSHLLADIDRIDAGQSLGLHRDHDAGAEAADFSAQIREGGRRTQMAIKALSAGLGNMSKRYEADASAIETSRRAVGRARLDDLIAEIDKNIAAGTHQRRGRRPAGRARASARAQHRRAVMTDRENRVRLKIRTAERATAEARQRLKAALIAGHNTGEIRREIEASEDRATAAAAELAGLALGNSRARAARLRTMSAELSSAAVSTINATLDPLRPPAPPQHINQEVIP